jgi:hypothetical protein
MDESTELAINIDVEASFFDLSDTSTGDTYALREQLLAAAAL